MPILYTSQTCAEANLQTLAIDPIFSQPDPKPPLNRHILEKIYEARQYMRQQIEKPPTLKELARKMGINEFKLKQTYKLVFNTTIFDDFNQYRMERARLSLLETDLTIAVISLSTGYEDPPNFIRAFKKYFGIAPSVFRKQHAQSAS